MNHAVDAIALTGPDDRSHELVASVEHTLAHMAPGSVLEVPCDVFAKLDLASWALDNGHRIVSRFDHWRIERLILEKNPVAPSSAA